MTFDFQTLQDASAIRRRLLQFVVPVTILSVAFNVPKFFEATVEYDEIQQTANDTTKVTKASYTLFFKAKHLLTHVKAPFRLLHMCL